MKENFNIIIGNVVYIKDCNNYGVIESLYSENNCNFVVPIFFALLLI